MTQAAAPSTATGWLRSPAFDGALVFGVLVVALVLGGTAWARPALFPWVLGLDVWLFAYPHVTSTYTRIAFDRDSARRHWFLLFGLPPLVLAATGAIGAMGGAGALFTVYFVGQTYHYTRQSFGIARAYRRAGGAPESAAKDPLADAVVYAFPAWGLLHRAQQGHASFYDQPLFLPRVPALLAHGAGVVAVLLLVTWLIREIKRPAEARAKNRGHASLLLTHVFITTLSYVVISEITAGWLFVNIWHNAQYLLFVWAFNARRFAAGKSEESPFLAYLCRPANAWMYAAFCVLFGAGLYALLGEAGARVSAAALPVVLICHLSVNFHHYLVDGVVWTRRGVKAAMAPRSAS